MSFLDEFDFDEPEDVRVAAARGYWSQWVRELPPGVANAGQRAVLFVLATYADADGKAWPSQETIAAGAGMHERQARRHLKALAEAGLIEVERHKGGGADFVGKWRPSLYMLRIDHRSYPTTGHIRPVVMDDLRSYPTDEGVGSSGSVHPEKTTDAKTTTPSPVISDLQVTDDRCHVCNGDGDDPLTAALCPACFGDGVLSGS